MRQPKPGSTPAGCRAVECSAPERLLYCSRLMQPSSDTANDKSDHTALYKGALQSIQSDGIGILVGGAYALRQYAGVIRDTKDLDVFVRPADVPRTLAALERAGFRTDIPYPHWLAKGYAEDRFIDVIFCSGNGLCTVDDEWFENGVAADVLGLDARLVAIEEMIWTKSFVMERERFDGADVAHLLLASGERIRLAPLARTFRRQLARPVRSSLVVRLHLSSRQRHDTRLGSAGVERAGADGAQRGVGAACLPRHAAFARTVSARRPRTRLPRRTSATTGLP